MSKRSLLKRRNKEFHDPDAAIVTQLMRWPFDDALDMFAFRFSSCVKTIIRRFNSSCVKAIRLF